METSPIPTADSVRLANFFLFVGLEHIGDALGRLTVAICFVASLQALKLGLDAQEKRKLSVKIK
jgi:hypothetical protein